MIGSSQEILWIIAIAITNATLIRLMYVNLRKLIQKRNIDNSLNDGCQKTLKEKEKIIKNLHDRNDILMNQNTRIMKDNESLAILLSQKNHKL